MGRKYMMYDTVLRSLAIATGFILTPIISFVAWLLTKDLQTTGLASLMTIITVTSIYLVTDYVIERRAKIAFNKSQQQNQ